MSRAYWLDLFTGTTWAEFLAAGATVSGFRAQRKSWAKRIKPGDYFLCYLAHVSRFIGILEVTSELYESDEPIWADEVFPVRFDVKIVAALKPETAVPVHDILNQFSWYSPSVEKGAWGARFLGSPTPFSVADGEMVAAEILSAQASPVVRPVDQRKLSARPGKGRPHPKKPVSASTLTPAVSSGQDAGTPPVTEEPSTSLAGEEPSDGEEEGGTVSEVNAHTEIEALLLRIGSAMGLELWIDPGDRGKTHEGVTLGEIEGVLDDLPLPFNADVLKTIRRIDVIWLEEQMVVGAFEVESTTSIYSGLLRMADLVAMNPNLTIPMFIVAPDARRARVRQEILRPTFSRLFKPPMAKRCRYIAFDTLRERYALLSSANILGALSPEALLHSVSEVVEPGSNAE